MGKTLLFGVLVDDPEPVFEWLDGNVASHVVRKMAYETVLGWHVKIALNGAEAISLFESRWSEDFWNKQGPTRRAKVMAARPRN